MAARPSFLGVVLLPVLFSFSTARADSGDMGLSLEAVGYSTPAVGLVGSFRYGLSDVFSLEAGLGGGLHWSSDDVVGVGAGALGVVAALDVFSWVPEFELGVGATGFQGDFTPIGYLGLKCRWVLDFNWSLFVGGQGAFSLDNLDFSGVGRVGFSYQFD